MLGLPLEKQEMAFTIGIDLNGSIALFLFDEHRVGLSDPLCRPCEFKVFCALCGFALGKRSHRGIFTTKLLRQNTS